MTIDPDDRGVGNDVVDVADGFDIPYWLIETSVFSVRWPIGFAVNSPQDTGDGTPFYLQGPGEATIFTQGPVPRTQLSDPDEFIADSGSVSAGWRLVTRARCAAVLACGPKGAPPVRKRSCSSVQVALGTPGLRRRRSNAGRTPTGRWRIGLSALLPAVQVNVDPNRVRASVPYGD
ncbi:hypothetical protein [Micromonospora sp. NPDC005203]|uniref:hypothetical protein n=1 Tax=Micromonospora sp. NPDC005203 TaxID=3364226 RepID=UPI00368DB026